jgi:hypothetical protein
MQLSKTEIERNKLFELNDTFICIFSVAKKFITSLNQLLIKKMSHLMCFNWIQLGFLEMRYEILADALMLIVKLRVK